MQVSMVIVLGILNVKVLRGCIRQFSLDYALHNVFCRAQNVCEAPSHAPHSTHSPPLWG